MRRRTWLGVMAGVLSGGCLGAPAPSQTEIAWLRLENNRAGARDIEVVIERNDDEVFNDAYQLGATAATATTTVDDPVDGQARYTVYIDIGDQVIHLHPSEFADAGLHGSCVGITFTLHEQGTTGFEFEPLSEC